MERIDYLPIGSVVMVKGGIKSCMVIARGVGTKVNDEMQVFDYGACLYPEGMVGDSIIYFNHKDIDKVLFRGYDNDDNKTLTNNINELLGRSGIKKGDPYELNMQNIKKYGKN